MEDRQKKRVFPYSDEEVFHCQLAFPGEKGLGLFCSYMMSTGTQKKSTP